MKKHTNILQRKNYERKENKKRMRRMEISNNFKRSNKNKIQKEKYP